MTIFRYDKSWEGLLTAVYDAYSRHEFPERLLAADDTAPMFVDADHLVDVDADHALRVWKGVVRRVGQRAANMLMHAWLSEEEHVDELIFRYLRKIFDQTQRTGASTTAAAHANGRYDGAGGFNSAVGKCNAAGGGVKTGIETNFTDPDVLAVHKIALRVAREGEHVRQFLRFQKAADGSYFAPIAPKYNALPLAVDYLTDRFADQRWLVYDTSRHYGYYFDTQHVKEVTMEDDAHLLSGRLSADIMAAGEEVFERAWHDYLGALTIRERLNPRLQRQHMPQRFWRFMPDKKRGTDWCPEFLGNDNYGVTPQRSR